MKLVLFLNICFVLLLSGCANRKQQSQTTSAVNTTPNATPITVNSPDAPPVAENKKGITNEIRTIVAKQLGLNPQDVGVDTPLSKLKKTVDELDVVELIMTVEETFNIEIKDDELSGGNINAVTNITVKQLADIVVKRKGAK